MKQRDISAFAIAFFFMLEYMVYQIWTGTPDRALYLYHIQYHDAILAYGVLWTWMNPFWWTDALYKMILIGWAVGLAIFEYWLWKKGKLPKGVLIMAQFQNTIWTYLGGYQQVTVTGTAALSFWNPLFIIPWILQKLPLGWSWNLSDSHWACAFGPDKIGYVINGVWYQGCGPGLFAGNIGLFIWHFIELAWVFASVIYWTWRWRRGIKRWTLRILKFMFGWITYTSNL